MEEEAESPRGGSVVELKQVSTELAGTGATLRICGRAKMLYIGLEASWEKTNFLMANGLRAGAGAGSGAVERTNVIVTPGAR
jgi:hypothetical protein